jgi:hypothetical protein
MIPLRGDANCSVVPVAAARGNLGGGGAAGGGRMSERGGGTSGVTVPKRLR